MKRSKKYELKILHMNVCLSKKELVRSLAVQNTGWTGPG